MWASWCGPCLTLGPILEKVIGETGGAVELVKVDIDANPAVAARFRVQSIPAVFAMKGGAVVDQFVGAVPESQVRQFVATLAPPKRDVDVLTEKGDEVSLRAALALESDHQAAVLALALLLAERGDGVEALALLARIPETAESRRVAAIARVGADPVDPAVELDSLLDHVKADEVARQRFLDLLEVLGAGDPRTADYRKALTARLF